ncbi:DUF6059 family protein [Streptomyces sp. NPDC001843]|uniref:DUF6059 family protein n=1 Tax=Streptomyces sp. NPDC001843 TaxID=3364617 RepID=UPI0036761545
MGWQDGFCPYRYLRGVWDGLVAVGMLHTLGDVDPEGYVRHSALYHDPPPGHPEQLLPQVRLTPLEQRLAREMNRPAPERRGRAA